MMNANRQFSTLILCLLLGVIVSIFSACRSDGEGETDTNQPDSSIVVGVALSLTGDVASYGERSRRGIMLAVEEINGNGGINGRTLEVKIEDTRSLARGGVTAINRLIDQYDVPVIVGDVLSSTTLAMAPIAEKNKVVLLAPGASNPDLREAGDYIFRNWASDNYDGLAMASYMHEQTDVDSISILAQRTDYSLGLANAFEQEFTKRGGAVLGEETFETSVVDLRSQLTKLADRGTKNIYLSAESRQTGLALRQAAELDLGFRWFTNLTVATSEAKEIAGDARNGVVFSTPAFNVDSEKPEVKRFVNAYRAKYDEDPDAAAGHAYDAMMILAQVMRNGATQPGEIKEALYDVEDFPGVTGVTTFDEKGDVLKGVFIKKIVNDTPNILQEFDYSREPETP